MFDILEGGPEASIASLAVNGLIFFLIIVNVAAVMLETVDSVAASYGHWLRLCEITSVAVFTIEYVLRLVACTESRHYQGAVTGRIRYMFTPLAMIDLLAVLPFYVPLLIPIDLRVLRVLRLMRMFRLLKLGRYSRAIQTLAAVLRRKAEQLMVCLFAMAVLLVLAGSLLYYAEHEAQPDVFCSIPASLWWGIATLTTVGYGDIYAITAMGKVMAGLMAVLGVGLFALPAGIVASGFSQTLENGSTVCPHCGKRLQ